MIYLGGVEVAQAMDDEFYPVPQCGKIKAYRASTRDEANKLAWRLIGLGKFTQTRRLKTGGYLLIKWERIA